MDWYPWVVVVHVVAVIVSFGAHGVSAFAMFRVRSEPDRARLAALLDLSTMSVGVMSVGLLVALVTGIVAAVMGSHFSRTWPWVSIGVIIAIIAVMTPLAASPMSAVRAALGMPIRGDKKGAPPRTPASDADLAAARAALRPELIAVLGTAAIVVLVWLMVVKPF